MCEGVNTCPSTGRPIKEAPCQAIASLVAACAGQILTQTPKPGNKTRGPNTEKE